MGLTINGFYLLALTPFPIYQEIVLLRFTTGTANEDVYEDPYHLETIGDYPGC